MIFRLLFILMLCTLLGSSFALADGDGGGDGGADGGAPDPCLEGGGHWEHPLRVPPAYDDDGNPIRDNVCVMPPKPPETDSDTGTSSSPASSTESGAASGTGETQKESLTGAQENFFSASRLHASVSILNAAEGLSLLGDPEGIAKGGVQLLESENEMDAAVGNHDSAAKVLAAKDSLGTGAVASAIPPLQASERLLRSAAAEAIFDTFEKKFPMTREEFTQKMLGSKGNLTALEAELNLKEGTIETALATARELKGEDKYKVMASSKASSLRKELRARLSKLPSGNENSGSNRQPRENRQAKVDTQTPRGPASPQTTEFKNLSAESKDFFGSQEKQGAELTIFDVVHRKYQEKIRSLR